jgi:drug/metabolite transporter (DMT)-like permease
MAALVSAAVSAVALLLVRSLVTTEKTSTIVLWFSTTASVLALLTIPFGWSALTGEQIAFLVASGLCGGIAQMLMTESYRHAEASTVAPFEYTSMILGIAVGYLIFGDVPTVHMLVGGAIVVAAGIFIILREHQLGLKRGAARRLVPPQG